MTAAAGSDPEDAETLWAFAVRVYGQDGVAPLCLRLQDEHGLDVDVLLALLWRAQRGHGVDEEALARLLAAAGPARSRVGELRALRRAVGADVEHDPRWRETYERLKAAELAAERVELQALETAALAADDPRPAAAPAPMLDCAALARDALERYAEQHAERGDAISYEPLLHRLADIALNAHYVPGE